MDQQPEVQATEKGGKKPVALIIIIAIVVLAVGGFLVWKFVINRSSVGTGTTTSSERAVANATNKACLDKYNDKDLCEFTYILVKNTA